MHPLGYPSPHLLYSTHTTLSLIPLIPLSHYAHQALLGDTIEQIAWQKAGIIKPHGHVFTSAAQNPIALEIIRQVGSVLH